MATSKECINLHRFAENGNETKLAAELVKATEADVNCMSLNSFSPLLIACQNNHSACVKKLVDTKGIDVNFVDKDGRTALFIAAEFGYPDVVRELLLAKDIDINMSPTSGDNEGKTPLEIVKSHKFIMNLVYYVKKEFAKKFEDCENIEKQIEDFAKTPKLHKSETQSQAGITIPTGRLGGRGSTSKSNKRKSTNRKYKKNRKTKRSRR